MGSGHQCFVKAMAIAIPKKMQNKMLLTHNQELNIVNKRPSRLHTMAIRSVAKACLPKKEEKFLAIFPAIWLTVFVRGQ